MKNQVKFEELNEKDQYIVYTANDILWLWRELIRADKEGRGWHELRARQAYQDAILAMKRHGLISDYDCLEVRVKVNGCWYSDRRQLTFVQTGPEVPAD